MKISVVGHKELGEGDVELMAPVLARFVADPDVDEMFFSGTEGAGISAFILALRMRQTCPFPRLVLILPDRIDTVLPWTPSAPRPAEWVGRADEVVELGIPLVSKNGFRGFHKHVEHLVERVAVDGQLLAFWNGNGLSATGHAVMHARKLDVPWEHIPIRGEE